MLKPACENGDYEACFRLGERYRILDQDEKAALPFLEKSCELAKENDNTTGCSHAGILLMKRGAPYSEDFKKAAQHLEKACNGRNDRACYNMGTLKFKEGKQKAAIKYFDLACQYANKEGCARAEKLRK
jgi:TPR repeat protein